MRARPVRPTRTARRQEQHRSAIVFLVRKDLTQEVQLDSGALRFAPVQNAFIWRVSHVPTVLPVLCVREACPAHSIQTKLVRAKRLRLLGPGCCRHQARMLESFDWSAVPAGTRHRTHRMTPKLAASAKITSTLWIPTRMSARNVPLDSFAGVTTT